MLLSESEHPCHRCVIQYELTMRVGSVFPHSIWIYRTGVLTGATPLDSKQQTIKLQLWRFSLLHNYVAGYNCRCMLHNSMCRSAIAKSSISIKLIPLRNFCTITTYQLNHLSTSNILWTYKQRSSLPANREALIFHLARGCTEQLLHQSAYSSERASFLRN